ncbi:endonuclease V [Marinibactrum halimedae]|uniref:Endonuclease V n=1 Tax=Marinibactrum halimedae TaxID=1444977 RepID=A0AA37WKP6_9GAMM|nr:endonuclease V [Marinibactrum halimedae]MCD9460731.1 endonuclease V [Marinibactrum halimedae]GLS25143.1 endonuclease V [Marinibactrum halimedae]
MILAIDVQYSDHSALAAGVLFDSWVSSHPIECFIKAVPDIQPYEPGAFYKRELPCILALLEEIPDNIEVIVVDGFVTLGREKKRGLGMHLYEALDNKIAVVGVAKKAFKDTPLQAEVYRGQSNKPLFVTSVGISQQQANSAIVQMHGKHRIPTLLKKADQLCRGIST